ncbi:1-acyl-sn-glycerol-3-phosphate acyltransferase [Azospirillum sp. RWY-5-1]|uniref:1-acyl-sn-glycerol-3-phosphate acyltransferase n=1 Tax=Azospirillum oleiclasticum TaxID=2735135 RepID=A0ABX2TC47_9PROT|nr:1-acyl-sn-glycerol-3-phosphate acyltransferase [Azospirillum oleiclasticum]NYZ15209.1 1-acyl-sn-glycerol-3-phosphate acyltransferase [Azospirillum oleiclasticum]NYZ21370.1 1-acyl-sn-glycerol-3-phosphate acyltransferase [Azospirillum oleiclasticum]
MIALRSLLFNIAFYGWTTIACFGLLWMLLLPRRRMIAVVRWYLDTVGWLERVILGLDYEVRGRENLPAGACIVAAKHQSAWETMKLHALFGDPAIVLKRELTWIPIWGWYARKARMIAVDRGARGKALSSMIENSRPVAAEGRPIVIFPQGTRTAPGAYRGYRVGVGALYEQLRLPIVPVALNSGVFWGRNSFMKRSGTIVVEILPPIQPGLPRAQAMAELESRLEAATDRLVVAAGGPPTVRNATAAPARAVAPAP